MPIPSIKIRRLAPAVALVYVIAVPFDGAALIPGNSAALLITPILFSAVAWDLACGWRYTSPPFPLVISAGLLAIWVMASYFWSVSPGRGFTKAISVVTVIATTLVVSVVLRDRVRLAVGAFIIATVLLAIRTLLQPAAIDMRRAAEGNANDIAVYMAMGLVLVLVQMMISWPGKWLLGLGAIALLVVALVATGSRTGVAATFVGILGAVFSASRLRRRRVIRQLLTLSVFGAILWAWFPIGLVPARFLDTAAQLESGDVSGRGTAWAAIWANGITPFGLGAGSTEAYLGRTIGVEMVAHNVWLELLLELGLVGVILFIALVATMAHNMEPDVGQVLLPALLVLLVASFSLSITWGRGLWMLVAFSYAGSLPVSRTGATEARIVGAGGALG